MKLYRDELMALGAMLFSDPSDHFPQRLQGPDSSENGFPPGEGGKSSTCGTQTDAGVSASGEPIVHLNTLRFLIPLLSATFV